MGARAAAALVAAALLAGCAGGEGVVTYADYVESRYTPREAYLAQSYGPLPLTVRGNPFAVEDAVLAARVAEAMSGRNFGPPMRFSPNPVTGRPYDYRVVVAFNQPPVETENLCKAAGPVQASARDGTVHARGAFCIADQRLTEIQGRVGGVTGPDDPGFQALLTQITLALFPAALRRDSPPCPFGAC